MRGRRTSSGVAWDHTRAVGGVFGAPRGPGKAGRTPSPGTRLCEGSGSRLETRGLGSSRKRGSDHRFPLRPSLSITMNS